MIFIGGGIMSATYAKILKELNPGIKLCVIEAMPEMAMESSNAINNAGTGHAGLCELNFTDSPDGEINLAHAIEITEAFEVSKQFWSYLVENHVLKPEEFIHSMPHMSFVDNHNDSMYLKFRQNVMSRHHFYESMEFSNDPKKISEWIPLIENGRNNQDVSVTRSLAGTDVNFGVITKKIFNNLKNLGVDIHNNVTVTDIKKRYITEHDYNSGFWRISTKTNGTLIKNTYISKRVFIGAGGASIKLLEKTGIPESKGYAGLPVSGKFLMCKNKGVIDQHNAKVYGKASVGAPPMSVPHMDTRIINGEKRLLFGPFPGMSTKLLKNGSWVDFFKTLHPSNIKTFLVSAYKNKSLVKYLIKESLTSFNHKMDELRKFYPNAKNEDWELITAGQRVQVIKTDENHKPIIKFGTETVISSDGSLTCLLGASPGASTSVSIIIDIIEKSFSEMGSYDWEEKMREIIPSYNQIMAADKKLYKKINSNTTKILKIN